MRIEKATMRSAEEVAREMVSDQDRDGWLKVLGIDVELSGWEHVDLRKAVELWVDRLREEGAAAAIAAQQPRDLANVGRATTCGTCLTALSEEPHRPGCPEPGYTAERQRVAALVRAARRWAAEARKTGRPAEEQIAADLDLVEAVEALDGAAAAQQPTETIEQQEARHRVALRRAREESHDASLYGDPEQPRDLAGRIRALVQEYAGLWADGARLPESRHLRVEACMHAMRWLWHTLRRMDTDGAFPEDRIAELRKHKGDDIVAKTMRKVADDLERIVRECEAQR